MEGKARVQGLQMEATVSLLACRHQPNLQYVHRPGSVPKSTVLACQGTCTWTNACLPPWSQVPPNVSHTWPVVVAVAVTPLFLPVLVPVPDSRCFPPSRRLLLLLILTLRCAALLCSALPHIRSILFCPVLSTVLCLSSVAGFSISVLRLVRSLPNNRLINPSNDYHESHSEIHVRCRHLIDSRSKKAKTQTTHYVAKIQDPLSQPAATLLHTA
ncbi:hypothetical protein LZ32DRAFT_431006 [Colletotrichum eremochloae]|nr:hypothetical protein LZ32DRAFT_431006 [Colletotrichum eremochloae]